MNITLNTNWQAASKSTQDLCTLYRRILTIYRKMREKAHTHVEKPAKPAFQVMNINNEKLKQMLQLFAQRLAEKDSKAIEKSDRRRLIQISEYVFENLIDPQPVYENIASILDISPEKAQVMNSFTICIRRRQ